MLLADHLYEIATRGYTKIAGALPADRVARLADAVDRLLDEDDATWGWERLTKMGQRGALRNLCDQDEAFESLLSDSPVYEIIDALIGTDYILHSYDALVLFPGDGRYPWDFHTDVMPLAGMALPASRSVGVNCLYYLGQVDEANGATWLVPSSHRSVLADPQPEILASLAVPAGGAAGDALLFDARLWHCSGVNGTNRRRALIKALFCPTWLRPQMDYSRSVRPQVMTKLDPRTRRLLGEGVSPPVTVEALRSSLAG